jgi:hypothetical protein
MMMKDQHSVAAPLAPWARYVAIPVVASAPSPVGCAPSKSVNVRPTSSWCSKRKDNNANEKQKSGPRVVIVGPVISIIPNTSFMVHIRPGDVCGVVDIMPY